MHINVVLRPEGFDRRVAAEIAHVLDAAGLRREGEAPVVVVVSLPDGPVARIAAPVPVLVVAAQPQGARISEALSAGAAGVIPAEEIQAMLVPAIHAVAGGLVVVPATHRIAMDRPDLSVRERQVLGMVVMGLTNGEIARRLYLAEATVKYHLSSIYDKLGVRTRKAAAAMVLDPRTGLSLGIMSVTGRGRTEGGYSEPRVE